MLPAGRTQQFSLADVLPNCLAALGGEANALELPPVSHAVVVLADGLGEANLRARRGHARTLASRLERDLPLDSGFPTTTVAALASLTTGAATGEHGMVGYTAFDPDADRLVNVLSGWDESGLDPRTWQSVPTLFERGGVASVAIGPERYRSSGLTEAVLRGAEYRGANRLHDRVQACLTVLNERSPRLVYLYAPETDIAAHHSGAAGSAYTAAIEALDDAVATIAAELGASQGMLVTADHGIVDVPVEGQRVVPAALLADVRLVAGEPRGLQLHLQPDTDLARVIRDWRAWVGDDAWVTSRADAIAAGWFGPRLADGIAARIGDVLVVARSAVAYYADESDRGRGMVGQHGALTEAERTVPLLRYGAFAR